MELIQENGEYFIKVNNEEARKANLFWNVKYIVLDDEIWTITGQPVAESVVSTGESYWLIPVKV